MNAAVSSVAPRAAPPRGSLLALALLTVLAYAPGLRGPLSYDDAFLVQRSPVVIGTTPPGAAFRLGYWEGIGPHRGNEYRPLTILALALEHRWFDAAASGYRVVSWVLHLGCVLLLGALASRLGLTSWAVLGAQAVFALHPIHVEAVTGIVGQAELLQTGLSLAAVLVFLTPGLVAACLWPLLALAALLAKESAIVTPILAALTADWLRRRGAGAVRSPRLAFAILPILGVYFLVRARVLGGVAGLSSVSPIENPLVSVEWTGRTVAGAWLLARYAWLHLFPVRLSVDYGLACLAPPTSPWQVPGLLALGLWAAAALGAAARPRSLGFLALAWFVLGLAIASNVAVPIGTIFGERLAYLSSVGISLASASLFAGLGRRRPDARKRLAALVLGLFAIRTAARNVDFASDIRLFESAVEVCPGSVKARYNLAALLAQHGYLDRALANLGSALEVKPDWALTLAARGRIFWQLGRAESAAQDFESAHRADPENAVALAGLGDVARASGDCERAIRLYRAAERTAPGDPYVREGLEHCGAG